ncbi:serine hydrolase domain-containing protein [Alteromonas sediminis]|nr:serine hydrolase domain-containing protein [Alteromonas sediminis]
MKLTLIKLSLLAILFCYSILGWNNAFAHEQIEKRVLSYMQEKGIPALQIAVVKNSKIVFANTYGKADLSFEVAANDDTVFAINSMTKAFVGVALMQLVEQKKVRLTDTLGQYFDDIPATWQRATIAQLMAHQSGIPDVMDDMARPRSPYGWESTWRETLVADREFEEGEQFNYNQTGYVLIGRLISRLSGQSFQDFITEKQLQKVSMPRTAAAGFNHYAGIISNSATGYTRFSGPEMQRLWEAFPEPVQTAAGMQSTATELASWLIALQSNVLLKEPKSLQTLFTPVKLNNGSTAAFGGPFNGYGIGWPLSVQEGKTTAIALGGARSVMAVYPETGVSIVILTNLQGGFPERLLTDVHDAI